MSMVSFESSGDFDKTYRALSKLSRGDIFQSLEASARQGVAALAAATPTDSGATAAAWGYTIKRTRSQTTISWTNSNMAGDTPVAILLQYGHGTGTGGYVVGRDFINPAMQAQFEIIAQNVWKAVTSA